MNGITYQVKAKRNSTERIDAIIKRGFELIENDTQHDFFVKLAGVINAHFPEVNFNEIFTNHYRLPPSVRDL